MFRENRILFPLVWTMLLEGGWTVIKEMSRGIGYLVEVKKERIPKEKPIPLYEMKTP